jgi:diamine N-acetyltransferase
MTITVRRAQASDAETVALLGRLTFREAFGDLFEEREDELLAYLNQTFSVAKIASSMSKSQNQYWLASINDLPIGYAKQRYPSANTFINDPAPVQLQKIYILAEFIAHQIGRALMTATMQAAAVAKVKNAWLTVLETNHRAISFHKRQGWTRVGEASFTIGTQDFSFLVMATGIGSD